MKILALPLLIVALALAGCAAVAPQPKAANPPTAAPASTHTSVAKLFDDYTEEWLPLNPLAASSLGDHRYDKLFPDTLSDAYRRKLRGLYTRYLADAQRFDPAALAPGDRLSLQIFRWELENKLALMDNSDYLRPVHQLGAVPSEFALLGSGANVHPFNTVRDYENFLQRVDGFNTWIDTAIGRMREGANKGITQPRVLMERSLPQLKAMLVDDPKQSIFYQPIAKLPAGFSAQDKARLTAAYENAIRRTIVPAYSRLHDFIRDEYLPRCRTTAGIGALPGGAAEYARNVRNSTTTDMTPEQIHELGLELVRRTQAEMTAIKERAGFKGELKAFNEYLNTDAQFFPFNTDEQVLDFLRRIEATINARVPRYFGLTPKSRFEIRATEKFRAEAASAQYVPGTRDGMRPGIFYIPISDPRKISSIGLEDLFIHEAIPGHHFQFSLQQELDLPRFRQSIWYSAYGEGWAVYAETMGQELGVFKNPYEEFARLVGQLRGAVSLVVDTGLHARGWTREQAIAYFLDTAVGSEALAENRVERYMAWPGQTLSYLIGETKILELRARAEKALDAKFDIRAFHDEVLKDGGMPLALLEAKIDAWTEARRRG